MDVETVISIFASSLGLRKDVISAKSRFFQLGGNSANAVATWLGLRKAGFTLKLQDLLSGNLSAEEICAQENVKKFSRDQGGFKIVPLLGQTLWSKEHIIEFTLTEFLKNPAASKSILETPEEFLATGKLGFDLVYESLLSEDLSFALQDNKTGQLMGLSILSPAGDIGEDAFEDVPFPETLKAIEDAFRIKFTPLHHEFRTNEEKWCKSLLVVTSSACSPQESAMALHAMNEQAERICREKGFKGIFAEDIDAATKVQYRHLIPALNAWAARAWYTTARPIATKSPGYGCMAMTSQLNVAF